MLKIKWFGHSMWKISTEKVSLIIDPFTDIGYKVPQNETADIVISTHDHFDHNNFGIIKGNPEIVKSEGIFVFDHVKIETFAVWHDETKGSKRGNNLLVRMELAERTFLHCGDLGHMLSQELMIKLGKIDVIFIPVGGYYTIDAVTAKKIVDYLKPAIIFPMHYKTKVLDFPISEKEEYLKLIGDYQQFKQNYIDFEEKDFNDKKTVILDYV
ncbi:MAG: MBL fold metallo-hydrolase [Candidatus Cloacimonetes bacterium]|nr:MBL fold metallo-hydrolase [Candidatus Cloacimonadota bacterium]